MDKHLTHFGQASSVVFRKKEPALRQGQIVVTKRYDSIAHEWVLSVLAEDDRERALEYGQVVSENAAQLAQGEDVEALDAFADSIPQAGVEI